MSQDIGQGVLVHRVRRFENVIFRLFDLAIRQRFSVERHGLRSRFPVGIYLNHGAHPRLPCDETDVPFTANSTAGELVSQLTAAGISYREGGAFDARYSVGEESVSVVFDDQGRLDSFQLSARDGA
jgi:hypothetical protein